MWVTALFSFQLFSEKVKRICLAVGETRTAPGRLIFINSMMLIAFLATANAGRMKRHSKVTVSALFVILIHSPLSYDIRHSSFVIRHSNFLRPSSFEIRHSSFELHYRRRITGPKIIPAKK